MAKNFNPKILKKLYKPYKDSSGEDNGQVTIIGGSSLFHGAPLLALKVASRIVDMVFFTSPEPSVGGVAEKIKSKLLSFIWIPWDEIENYIEKSDAILIGPGFLRFRSEKVPHGERHHICDEACVTTRRITYNLLTKFPKKRWVIDAGSLQTMDTDWIPKDAILTPNKKEFQFLFGNLSPQKAAKKHNCVIVLKGPETLVCSPEMCVTVNGGNAGMTKGGTGDIQAGLTVALLAKNNPFLAASSAAFITKKAGDELYRKVGTNYNADDLADTIPETLQNLAR
ncbi:NAD(P)H-hydrate dehydratase [Candidatus Woesebacteria bacterium RIFOXYA1_FULL_40_18]|uniref:ADP-dependent (S)-NAD(P)H-hydrate dehydratase n=2 Tax=Candidatus Woeseibacteriota TaxID=1752722 RepID=A0A1F8CI43_9BACT|nr:MAG: NAD(P)H-hydrate dehydratase [Candidatus Woesebacteria bacterium RIFOXYA1_FULL_40_18]OGM86980.1 MAG: NAD(P)H-hydrate dehydratase [Candidatus Woesebacteria bacterium RIFOXYD1_FULL_40_21]